eukprot:m.144397 g.144397  ORF g.144397 m.144397 type:complete len:50 (-) comp16767_c0_seq1:1224-1373(-)
MCSNDFKCYLLRREQIDFIALFRSTVPTFAMRSVCVDLLENLLNLDLLK